jgi:hypothetical protein
LWGAPAGPPFFVTAVAHPIPGETMTKPKTSPARSAAPDWKRPFLAALAETSNVARAAKAAGISTSTIYETRRRNRAFAKAWQSALAEGYDNLELELLFLLREGEIKRAAGAKVGVRTFDNATAYRLLMVHREAVAKEKAGQANVSAADIRASIEKRMAALRERVLARSEAEKSEAADDDR